MLDTNPFAEISAIVPVLVMQAYVVLMSLLVAGGTIIDVLHKKSARYFFEKAKKAEKSKTRELNSRERKSILIKTIAEDVLASAEFCNPDRRMAHLLTMYGFIAFVVATVLLIFGHPGTADAPVILIQLWHLGALSVCAGGYWFWFFIRVDVAAESNPWYRVIRADLFILSLLATASFALIWSGLQAIEAGAATTLVFFCLFILASTLLFSTVVWSKFAHMFFKPAAAYQRRIEQADGSMANLPTPADEPEQFGLGIKRDSPRHY